MQEGGLTQGSSPSRSEGDPCREAVGVAAWHGGSESEQVEESQHRVWEPARGEEGFLLGRRQMSLTYQVRTQVVRGSPLWLEGEQP